MSTTARPISILCSIGTMLALLLVPAVHANVPACLTDNSDPDGDGWGWENNASCRVAVINNTECLDPDGDGWGWNGTQSCRPAMDSAEPAPTQQLTGLAAELVGSWQCYVGAIVPDWYFFRDFAMDTNEGFAYVGGCNQIGILTSTQQAS
ncbi:MAG: carbohydrate-binding domain-containing protein, partial [Pseudomonadota bacterium]